jgi:hypothetical protein
VVQKVLVLQAEHMVVVPGVMVLLEFLGRNQFHNQEHQLFQLLAVLAELVKMDFRQLIPELGIIPEGQDNHQGLADQLAVVVVVATTEVLLV